MSAIHIIAEAGTNHGGNLATAKKLVDVAATAKADSVKFQVIYPEGLYLTRLWQDGTLRDNPVVATRRAQMLSDGDYRALAAYARDKAMPFSASVFDERGVKLLDALDPPYIKIASCDLNNHPLLAMAAATGRRLVVSTGMSTLAEVDAAVAVLEREGARDPVLLHCVSVYPCPTSAMNLGFIDTLRASFGLPVGFSDHSESSVAVAIAVAKGATWIEKHFTLDRKAEGFDHAYAMEPDQLASYIADVRSAEAACSRPASKLGEAERTVVQRARRGLYAARDLPAGAEIGPTDILVVRPLGSLGPPDLPLVLGRTLRRAVRASEPFEISHFG